LKISLQPTKLVANTGLIYFVTPIQFVIFFEKIVTALIL